MVYYSNDDDDTAFLMKNNLDVKIIWYCSMLATNADDFMENLCNTVELRTDGRGAPVIVIVTWADIAELRC